LAILLFSVAALAQTETTMSCGIIDAGDADPDNPNYDFYCPSQYIIESCGLIYISVNVHFFVTDDCQGTTAAKRVQDRKEQEDTYLEAEKLINRANRYNEGISDNLQWNQAVNGATVTTVPQCVPFRYVLEGVYIHCESENRTLYDNSENSAWRNKTTYPDAVNVGIANVSGGPNGYAAYSGRYTVVENFMGGLFTHEFGHVLRLVHTFEFQENCDDTPSIDWWTYDRDNNGTIDYQGQTCWSTSNFLDLDGNGSAETDARTPNGSTIINTHPCCGRDDLISNNVMHYSVAATERSRAAMTPCQMSRALNTLFDEKCDLVRSVMPPCPPVSAFIGIVPSVSTNEDCAFTLHFESSMNESEHRIIVETLVGGVFRQPATPDWVDGRATDLSLAIGTNLNDKFADRVFLSNTTYRVTLETKSSCGGAASYSVEFTTGDCDVDVTGGGIILISEGGMVVYPNPANHGTRLTYQLNADSDVQIYWASLDVNGQFTPPQLKSVESGSKTEGQYFVDFSNEDLKNGLNYIILQAGEEIHYRSVAKN
jgi:hypothetical protein